MAETQKNGNGKNSKLKYARLSEDLQQRIEEDRAAHWVNPYACQDDAVVRRAPAHDKANLWRPAFVRDSEKILHLPYYNRYTDKTQVFSFYQNDDISRRGLHVQLVSRIARNIGAVLGLNLDLIEAIALGHDIGHTPFGHAGERFLDEILYAQNGTHFLHNGQSVRVLDTLFCRNLSLQTLDGILCHNGEFEQQAYVPDTAKDFVRFDRELAACLKSGNAAAKALTPMTLEGCVVRISDMIAYLGKDRQDARIAKILPKKQTFVTESIGTQNAEMINNLTVDILENSYGKDCIALSAQAFRDLSTAKRENYEYIYKNEALDGAYNDLVRPMFCEVYFELLRALQAGEETSPVYRHHIAFLTEQRRFYADAASYLDTDPNQIVADYIASMTDSYFLSIHKFLFPNSPHRVEFQSYFADLETEKNR